MYKITINRINSKSQRVWTLETHYLGTDPSYILPVFYNKYGNADFKLVKEAIIQELWYYKNGTNFWGLMIDDLNKGSRYSLGHGDKCGFLIEKIS